MAVIWVLALLVTRSVLRQSAVVLAAGVVALDVMYKNIRFEEEAMGQKKTHFYYWELFFL